MSENEPPIEGEVVDKEEIIGVNDLKGYSDLISAFLDSTAENQRKTEEQSHQHRLKEAESGNKRLDLITIAIIAIIIGCLWALVEMREYEDFKDIIKMLLGFAAGLMATHKK